MLCLAPPLENCTHTHDRWGKRAVPAAVTNKDILQQENGNENDWIREVSTVRQRTRKRATHLGKALEHDLVNFAFN